jgi:hypothetical protein
VADLKIWSDACATEQTAVRSTGALWHDLRRLDSLLSLQQHAVELPPVRPFSASYVLPPSPQAAMPIVGLERVVYYREQVCPGSVC